MSILLCPTIDSFVEFEMLSSKKFIKANQRILSLTIRNHTHNAVKAKTCGTLYLPAEVTNKNITKKFNIRSHSQKVIRVTQSDINERNGIESMQKYLKDNLPDLNFYVINMITETTCGNRHTCTWKRKKAAANIGGIWTLRLTHIDGKDVTKHFSEREMHDIAGSLSDQVCRLQLESVQVTKVLCTPIP